LVKNRILHEHQKFEKKYIIWTLHPYWMPIDAYLSIANLEKALLNILANIGNIYNITFD